MLKKTVTYTDFNDVEHTEDFYFNLSRNELLKLEMNTDKYPGGFAEALAEVSRNRDQKRMLEIFEDLLVLSYGKKSEDGMRFDKSKAAVEAFMSSPAYDVIFMELATNEEEATHFVNGIIPASLQNQIGLPSSN